MDRREAGQLQTAARAIKLANRGHLSEAHDDDNADSDNENDSDNSIHHTEHENNISDCKPSEHVHLEVKFSKTRRRHKVGPPSCDLTRGDGEGHCERRSRPRLHLALCAYLALSLASMTAAAAAAAAQGAETDAPFIASQRRQEASETSLGHWRLRNRIPIESVQKRRFARASSDGAASPDLDSYLGKLGGPFRLASNDQDDGGERASADDGDEYSAGRAPAQPNQTDEEPASNETCLEYENILKGRPSMNASIAFICAYAGIFFFGLAGNLLTIYVFVVKGCKRCSAQDVLICNLAISDVMLCVFAIPITPKYLVWDHYWKMGQFLCKVVSFTQSVSVYMSTYSLIVIGFIRYRLIVHPVGGAMSTLLASVYCLGTAVVAVLFTMPYVNKIRLSPDHCEVKFCDESWQGNERFYFSLFTCVFQLSIPLLAVIFFYFNIYRRVDYRKTIMATSVGGGGGGGAHRDRADQHNTHTTNHKLPPATATAAATCNVLEIKEIRLREKQRKMRRMNKRLLWVVCIFAFSWFPLNLYNLLSDYFDELSTWSYITYVFLITHLIACSSVVWNPFLYAWMSDSFMSDLERAMPGWLRCCRLKGRPAGEHSVVSEAGGGAGSRPGHSGVGGGAAAAGRCGSPTSIMMVSTNGHHPNSSQSVAMLVGRVGAAQPPLPPHLVRDSEQRRQLGVARTVPQLVGASSEGAKPCHADSGADHHHRQQQSGATPAPPHAKPLSLDELAAGSSQEEDLSDYEPEHDNESERDGAPNECQKCQKETSELNPNKRQFFIEICQ